MQKNTSYGNRKYYELYPEENLCTFTNARQNKFYWAGVHLWKWYHYEKYIGRTKNAVVYELDWIRKCSWSWKAMKKSVQTNCSSIDNRNRKKWQYKENWFDSQRELLVPLKQMENLQQISAVQQFKYVRMKLWESFFRFVSPPLKVHP